jgi:hypothetical protein
MRVSARCEADEWRYSDGLEGPALGCLDLVPFDGLVAHSSQWLGTWGDDGGFESSAAATDRGGLAKEPNKRAVEGGVATAGSRSGDSRRVGALFSATSI